MKSLLLVFLLTGLLIGCVDGGGETERKAKVQALINQLADESTDNKNIIYTELKDVYVRKRDIPELLHVIQVNKNSEITALLQKLVSFMDGRWRLPNKEWSSDFDEIAKAYEEEFKNLGCFVILSVPPGYPPKPDLMLDIFDYPTEEKNRESVIGLIYILEPGALALPEDWNTIEFVQLLKNLEELHIGDTKIDEEGRKINAQAKH